MTNTLILDLDNTLVHALTRDEKKSRKISRNADFILQLPETENENEESFHIYYRPYLMDFIHHACNTFDTIIVWSAGTEDYVKPTVRKIFQECRKRVKYIISQNTFDSITKNINNLIKEDKSISKSNIYFMDDIPERIKGLEPWQIITVPPYYAENINDDYFKLLKFKY